MAHGTRAAQAERCSVRAPQDMSSLSCTAGQLGKLAMHSTKARQRPPRSVGSDKARLGACPGAALRARGARPRGPAGPARQHDRSPRLVCMSQPGGLALLTPW